VQEKTAEAEELLWRKTCKQCHALDFAPGASLPCVAEARITARWMPHARFDHDAHRGFSCTSCHQAATRSTETTDVLLPGIATCKTCHGSGEGHAESRCYECHTYHDWSKRKEVKPTFTLPSLAAGGR
jgi:transcription elongation factor Elf1